MERKFLVINNNKGEWIIPRQHITYIHNKEDILPGWREVCIGVNSKEISLHFKDEKEMDDLVCSLNRFMCEGEVGDENVLRIINNFENSSFYWDDSL